MTNSNTEIKHIAKALVKFQGMMVNPPKRKTAKMGSFSYKFADLADIVDTIRKPLAECGLAYIQNVVTTETEIGIETVLIHESGEMLTFESVKAAKPKEPDPRKLGALITYLRKFSLQIATGCVCEEDTDCQEVDPAETPKEKKAAQPKKESRNLNSWKLLAVENQKIDRVSELRRFHGICKKQFNISDPEELRCLVWRFSNRPLAQPSYKD